MVLSGPLHGMTWGSHSPCMVLHGEVYESFVELS